MEISISYKLAKAWCVFFLLWSLFSLTISWKKNADVIYNSTYTVQTCIFAFGVMGLSKQMRLHRFICAGILALITTNSLFNEDYFSSTRLIIIFSGVAIINIATIWRLIKLNTTPPNSRGDCR